MDQNLWAAMGYPTLLALADIARRNGVTPKTAYNWSTRHSKFPKPVMTVCNGTMPLYLLEEVESYETWRRNGRDLAGRDPETGRFKGGE